MAKITKHMSMDERNAFYMALNAVQYKLGIPPLSYLFGITPDRAAEIMAAAEQYAAEM